MKTNKEIAIKTIRITQTAHEHLRKASVFNGMTLGGFIAYVSRKYSNKAVK